MTKNDNTSASHSHHTHLPAPTQSHSHSHVHTKDVLKRINNIIGHLQGISGMVVEQRDCSEVLIQLSAVNASVKKLKTIILRDHVEHCIVDAVRNGEQETLDKLNAALEKMME